MEFFVENIQSYLPDTIVRGLLKIVMSRTQANLRSKDFPHKELRLIKRIKDLDKVTFDTESANNSNHT